MQPCVHVVCLLVPVLGLLAGCATTPGLTVPARAFHQPTAGAQGVEYLPDAASTPAGARQVRLRPGQILEVFRSNPGDDPRELAFYLPIEARTVVQLVVTTKGDTKTYFLRAIRTGETVGSVVERRWLDDDGYNPRDVDAGSRVRAAVRSTPCFITVY